MLGRDEFDVATVVYNRFVSVISQVPTEIQLIPPVLAGAPDTEAQGVQAMYEFEPDEETILARLLPKNLEIQLYRTLLDSGAGEQVCAHVRHGQRDPERGRGDHQADAELQPHPPGQHHARTDRDHFRRGGTLNTPARGALTPGLRTRVGSRGDAPAFLTRG